MLHQDPLSRAGRQKRGKHDAGAVAMSMTVAETERPTRSSRASARQARTAATQEMGRQEWTDFLDGDV